MTKADKTLCAVYGAIAVLALVGTWSQNILFMTTSGATGAFAFVEACFANHAAASITIDVLFMCAAAFVFMGVEARRWGIRHLWVYIVLSFVIAVSVMFPLFLLVRQRRMALARASSTAA